MFHAFKDWHDLFCFTLFAYVKFIFVRQPMKFNMELFRDPIIIIQRWIQLGSKYVDTSLPICLMQDTAWHY